MFVQNNLQVECQSQSASANLALYGYNGRWLMLDCGLAFADETKPDKKSDKKK